MPATVSRESAAIREMLDEDEAPFSSVSLAARDSFSRVHQQLMNAIEEDVAVRATPARRFGRNILSLSRSTAYSYFMRYSIAAILFCTVGFAGHQIGQQQGAQALPVQTLVDDFDSNLKSAVPLDFIAADSFDARPAAHWLSTHVGRKVLLPAPSRSGTRIIGVRRHEIWGHVVAQAHYMKNGVRVGLYQIREPRAGLKGMQVAEVNGRTYLATQRGNYHVVVWRKGDDIVTMVSPLAGNASLRLAAALRDASPNV